MPRLEIFPDRISHNTAEIARLVHGHGAQLAGVGKVACAHDAVVDAMLAGGVDAYADSRVENLARVRSRRLRLPNGDDLPLLLLRLPEPSRIDDVVQVADASLVSEPETLRALGPAARRTGRTHGVIVMVDLGDLREGVWDEAILDTVAGAATIDGLDVLGIGTNMACYGGVIPSVANMTRFAQLVRAAREATGLELALNSGGNSATLPLLAAGGLPAEATHMRVGEAVVLGRNVLDRRPWPGTRQDTMRAVAEVIEVQSKPSIPLGDAGQNAFGETSTFIDRGVRRRAICALGRQDVVVDGLVPEDPAMIVLGASSDHLIIDVEEAAAPVRLGDEIAFWPSYGAALALATSPYVDKVVCA